MIIKVKKHILLISSYFENSKVMSASLRDAPVEEESEPKCFACFAVLWSAR